MERELINSQEVMHTEQMQDIIGTPPRWLYRWGITLVLAIAVMCILISASIDYPESVKTKLEILSTHLPSHIFSKDSTWLIKILEPNNVQVKKGDHLAIIRSTTGETVLKAPLNGKLTYANIIHEDEQLVPGRDIFLISVGYSSFYGKVAIPQNEVSRVKPGQTVLIRLSNIENRTTWKGIIRYIINDRFENGECFAEVDFDTRKQDEGNNNLLLKNGMMADAEIITAKATLLHRLIHSLTRGIK